jgi:hypothetical protein
MRGLAALRRPLGALLLGAELGLLRLQQRRRTARFFRGERRLLGRFGGRLCGLGERDLRRHHRLCLPLHRGPFGGHLGELGLRFLELLEALFRGSFAPGARERIVLLLMVAPGGERLVEADLPLCERGARGLQLGRLLLGRLALRRRRARGFLCARARLLAHL